MNTLDKQVGDVCVPHGVELISGRVGGFPAPSFALLAVLIVRLKSFVKDVGLRGCPSGVVNTKSFRSLPSP